VLLQESLRHFIWYVLETNRHVYTMDPITQMIVDEFEKRSDLKEIRKEINTLLLDTPEYNAIYESLLEMDGVTVTAKSAKVQALKMAYDHYKPSVDEEK
jgi:hypothetical protein